jgi:VCBS repeat-containing protein
LGTTQLAWLKQNLLDAQKNGTAWKFVSVSDPIDQIGGLGGADDGGKSWIGGYRAERNELLKFIADNKIDNVVFLACDDHQNRINEIGYYTDITDPKTFKLLPNALSIVDGPIGATGPDKYAADHSFASIKKLADDLAAKQTAAGVNPIGLDPKFMGLSNVKREGDPNADTLRQAVDFYSPDTFNYTTFDISADGKTLNVNVQGIDSYAVNTFPEPSAANPVKSILSFSLTAAQPNSPPVAGNDAFTTTEKAPVTGNVFAANPAATGTPDSDANKDPIVVSAIDGKAASVGTEITLASGALLTVKADGNFTYNPNGKFNTLADGAKGTDSFTYTISDGKGGTSTATSTFTITGVNDPAVIAGTITGAVTEDAVTNTATGTLTATDVDSPATFVAQDKAAGTYGTFSIGTDGKWTYALDNANAKTNALTAGQKVTDIFTAKTADGTAQAVNINVTGANDLAVIAGTAAVAVTKDLTKPTIAATGKLTVTDVDAGEAKFNPTVTPVGTNLGALKIDETGAYSYSVPTTALQSLVSGQTKVETFTVKSFDGSASQNIIATINGANKPVTPAPITTPPTPTPVPVTASNCFDLRELLGKVSCGSKVSASAAYDNYGGFYTVDDATGKIGGLKPSDTGYAAAALKRAVLSIHKTDTSGIYQLEGGQLLAPFLVANGNVSDFLSKNASNAAGNLPHAYFNFIDANPDKIEHMRSTGSNRYDCEDMFGGGDKDFNDFTLQLTVKPA